MTTTLRETKSGWSARIRMGSVGDKAQRPWLPMPAMKATEAESRHERLQRLATEFVRAGKAAEAERALRICAEQPTMKAFEVAERAARRSLTEAVDAKNEGPRTFRDVAELWTSGALHTSHPDEVPAKVEAARTMDRAILRTFFPLLGNVPMAAITRADTDKAKLAVPASLAPSTRRVYLSRCRYIFKLAQKLELIETLPLRPSFVPKRVAGREFWFLYPDEDERLVSCPEIELAFRLLYGFLTRNGSRISETLRLTYGHIDWRRGVVRIEKHWTKTKRGRFWKLDSDVLRALRRQFIATGRDSSRAIFTLDDGRRITRAMVDTRFIADLRTAGIDRAELLDSTADSRRLRAHDCRATFVTLARKMGRRFDGSTEIVMTDRWIMDRTGHETIDMLAKYERFVRHAASLDLGWFAPLDRCLYPQANPSDLDQDMDQETQMLVQMAPPRNPQRIASPSLEGTEQANSAAAARSNGAETPLGPPSEGGVDQRIATGVTAPVTSPRLTPPMLQELLELASKSRRWHLVTALADELEALAEARGGNVVQLDPRRRK